MCLFLHLEEKVLVQAYHEKPEEALRKVVLRSLAEEVHFTVKYGPFWPELDYRIFTVLWIFTPIRPPTTLSIQLNENPPVL